MLQTEVVSKFVDDGQEEVVGIAGLLVHGQVAAQLQAGLQQGRETRIRFVRGAVDSQISEVVASLRPTQRQNSWRHLIVEEYFDRRRNVIIHQVGCRRLGVGEVDQTSELHP